MGIANQIQCSVAIAALTCVGWLPSASAQDERSQLLELRAVASDLSERLNVAKTELSLLRAANQLGSREETLLELLGEVKALRERLIAPNAQVASKAGKPASLEGKPSQVLAVMEPERVVLISVGRSSDVLEGALVKIGSNGVQAKVIESRATVSAAVVQNSFQGKLADLVGSPAELSAR